MLRKIRRRLGWQVQDKSKPDTYQQYLKSRAVLASAPYDFAIFQNLVNSVLGDRVRFSYITMLDYLRGNMRDDIINVVIRHDVDTRSCAEKLGLFTGFEDSLGLRTAVYFRVDDEEYEAAALRDVAAWLKDRGFEVGLHSLVYTAEDMESKFAEERQRFFQSFGFYPRTFTLHGLGELFKENRARFNENIDHFIERFGYEGSDNKVGYRYVIEDCHRDGSTRVIMDDFLGVPGFLKAGETVLILTHPCYWQLPEGERGGQRR